MIDNQERIKKMHSSLTKALNPSELEIIDDSHKHIGHAGARTGQGHFSIIIQSKQFDNKTQLECHRLIYDALGDMMLTEIHALSIKIL